MAAADPKTATMPGRYASALFELAKGQDQVDAIEKDLGTFQSLLDESDDLRRLVRSPVFSGDDQIKALDAVLEKAGVGGLTANFMRVITQNRRLFAATDMISAFRAMASEDRGEVRADVTSAVDLTDEQVAALKDKLKASIGKDVQLDTRVDPSVLGGLIVKIGSRMIDSSLRTKLAMLKSRMKEAH